MATHLSQSNFDNIINYFTNLNSSTDDYFPPSGFYFQVTIDGISPEQARFQEVSGLDVEVAVERIKEAGENTFDHPVPGRTTYKNLVLKRGLLVPNSELADWVERTFMPERAYPITTHPITVTLMNPENRESLITWNFQ
jgi:phage tail-like protein